jgi:hypothetical protein
MSAVYKETAVAKTGLKVPVYASGKAAQSKYDPEREALSFGLETDGAAFAVIIGVAGGYQIKSFLNKNPGCKILAIENTAEDLDFLKKNIPCVSGLYQNKSVIFRAAEEEGGIESALLQNYFPAHHGALTILSLRSWVQETQDGHHKIAQRIQSALQEISADYSTQAHFGRLWTKNIFCNLMALKKMQESEQKEIQFDKSILRKTAAVIAAGPSLDKSACEILNNREKYFVIATDTALKIFSRRKIKVDAVVSIDAQHLSAEHFNGANVKDAIFVLDLAGNPSIAKFALQKKARALFTDSGHPLVSFAGSFCKRSFLKLNSGGGTVAVCAVDFARKIGFKKIKIFGADFGYSQGKAYAKGSYLDDLHGARQDKTQNAETSFCRLMFRTELEKNARGFLQSPTLRRYQKSMETLLGDWKWKDFIYEWEDKTSPEIEASFCNGMDFPALSKAIEGVAQKIEQEEDLTANEALILPEMAYWRKKLENLGQNKISTKEIKKLALKSIILYNKLI